MCICLLYRLYLCLRSTVPHICALVAIDRCARAHVCEVCEPLINTLLSIRVHFATKGKCAYYNPHTLLTVHTAIFDWYGTEPQNAYHRKFQFMRSSLTLKFLNF